MKYILPAATFVSYDYLLLPVNVPVTNNSYAVITDKYGRTRSSGIELKSFNDGFYVPWSTPEKSGSFNLSVVDNDTNIFSTSFYVLNESEARHAPGSSTIPHPDPPVFFSGDPLNPNSINIAFRTHFGLPINPNVVTYQFFRSDGVALSSPSIPTLESPGKFYVPGSLNLPGGEHQVEWVWRMEPDSPLRSIRKPVAVINYNAYSTSSGVCSGSVGYVCCACSPCKCLSDC